jgi:hypothetical protein
MPTTDRAVNLYENSVFRGPTIALSRIDQRGDYIYIIIPTNAKEGISELCVTIGKL